MLHADVFFCSFDSLENQFCFVEQNEKFMTNIQWLRLLLNEIGHKNNYTVDKGLDLS